MTLTDKKMIDRKGGFELQDLRDEKLHMVCLKGAELHGVDARDTSLEHVNFVNSKWNHIFFSNLHMKHAQLGGTLFENISRPNVQESQLEEEPGTDGWLNVEPVQFRHSDLSTAIFEDCNLGKIRVNNANLGSSHFNNICFIGAKITDANMSDFEIDGAQLGGAYIHHIGMPPEDHPLYRPDQPEQRPVRFEDCNFKGSTVTNCDLRNVQLNGCNIEGLTIDGIDILDLVNKHKQANS